MRLHIEWDRPIKLRNKGAGNVGYTIDGEKVPPGAGVYIFGRRFGQQFEALYVGQSRWVRHRVVNVQLKNLQLVQHLLKAKSGMRILLAGRLVPRPGQKAQRCLPLAERALIRHFLSEGHDLVNEHGTHLRQHELESTGKHPKRYFPRVMYLDRH